MGQGRSGPTQARWQRHEVDDERSVRRPAHAGEPLSTVEPTLDRILTELVGQVPEIEAAAVVSFDGLPMASALPAGMDEDRVAAMSAALLSLGERAAEGLGRGELSQVYVEGENGTVFLVSADDEAVLVAVAAKGAKVGLMLFEVRRAAAAVAEALRVETVPYDEPRRGAHAGAGTRCRSSRRRAARLRLALAEVPDRARRAGADMKLEGSLDAFSLPDIFQLLSFTKKTGGLHLAQRRLATASSSSPAVRSPVPPRTARASRSPAAWSAAAPSTTRRSPPRSQAATDGEGVGVVSALLEQGAVDAELLRQAATDQSVDAVFDLLRWQQRRLRLRRRRGQPRRRRRDRCRRGRPRRRRGAPGQLGDACRRSCRRRSAVLAMPVVLPADPQVSREEWSLLALVDGRRTRRRAGRPHRQRPVRRRLDAGRAWSAAACSRSARATATTRVRRPRRRRRAPPGAARPAGGRSRSCRSRSPGRGDRRADRGEADAGPGQPTAPRLADRPTPRRRRHAGRARPDADETTSDEADERELATASAGDEPDRCSAARTCRRTSCRRGPSRSCPSARPTSTSSPARRPPVRCTCRPGRPLDGGLGDVVGATATAPDPDAVSVIERDPNVNRSLMLRLIAGVRGL